MSGTHGLQVTTKGWEQNIFAEDKVIGDGRRSHKLRAKCKFPFTYRGKVHNNCVKSSHGPWCNIDPKTVEIKIKKKWVLASKFKKYGFKTSKLAVYWDRCKGRVILFMNVLNKQKTL